MALFQSYAVIYLAIGAAIDEVLFVAMVTSDIRAHARVHSI